MTKVNLTMDWTAEFMGMWQVKIPDVINLNPAEIYEWAANNSPPRATEDEIEEWFTKKLDAIFLQELICIFKTKDKLRIRGGQCTPYCRHEHLVDMMVTPDEWEEIREFHRNKRLDAGGE